MEVRIKALKLSELEPSFYRIKATGIFQQVDTFEQAQGVRFLCPACFVANGGPVGTHSILCWFRGRGVPDTETPGPARWAASGTGLEDLTLSPSILLTSGCRWHGFVRKGAIT